MFKEKTFQIALFISILAHGVILYNLPHFNKDALKKPLPEIKISYQELQIPKKSLISIKPQKTTRNKQNSDRIRIKKKNNVSPPQFPKDFFAKGERNSQKKPSLAKKLKFNKKVSLPSISTEAKISNPVYLNYYQKVREKIRRSAFRNFARMRSGEVYLTFVIFSTGTLERIKVKDERSKADNYLKQIAIKSVKECSPFPAFPKGLKYPELSFNVIISFEIGD